MCKCICAVPPYQKAPLSGRENGAGIWACYRASIAAFRRRRVIGLFLLKRSASVFNGMQIRQILQVFLQMSAQTERRIFRMAFLLMARIRVRSAMRASIPLFYEQSPFCSSFSLELYIYKFISYTLLYIEETEVLSLHSRGFFW